MHLDCWYEAREISANDVWTGWLIIAFFVLLAYQIPSLLEGCSASYFAVDLHYFLFFPPLECWCPEAAHKPEHIRGRLTVWQTEHAGLTYLFQRNANQKALKLQLFCLRMLYNENTTDPYFPLAERLWHCILWNPRRQFKSSLTFVRNLAFSIFATITVDGMQSPAPLCR